MLRLGAALSFDGTHRYFHGKTLALTQTCVQQEAFMLIFPLVLTAVALANAVDQISHRVGLDVITLPRGATELLQLPNDLTRVAVADTSIANVLVVSPREILVNAIAVGSTSLIVWDIDDTARTYTVEVTVDVGAIQRHFASIFPQEDIQVTAQGNVVVLSGTVSGGEVAQRMVEIARASGATVIRNFSCLRPSKSC
jgi:pilus assembly protein CpaC